jgi:transketolase
MKNILYLEPPEIALKANEIRKKIIQMNTNAGQGHTGADLSETDILASLIFRILKIDLSNPWETENRDRFIMSKGHGIGGLYCTLAEAGIMDEKLLDTYLQFDSQLPGHPVKQKNRFIELNTGALGHGLSVATGLALSSKLSQNHFKVYVFTGDGELQEGSNWEAAMSAAHFKLGNLVVIVDRNTLQLADWTKNIMALEPLDKKWEAFGFEVHKTEGNNVYKFISTIENLDLSNNKPKVVIASTTKGKGVSFIENNPAWHHKIPKGDEISQAIEELE